MNLAHLLTLMRACIGPIFLCFYLWGPQFGISTLNIPYSLLILVSLSEISDGFDGYVARRWNQVTDLGKILDPMADSLTRLAIFFTFTLPPVNLPLILVLILFYRDSVLSTLRTACALRGIALGARLSGKIKAVIQGVTIFLIIAMMILQAQGILSLETLQTVSLWATSIATFYTVLSTADYFYANRLLLKSLMRST